MSSASSRVSKEQHDLLLTLQNLQLPPEQWHELRQLVAQYLGQRVIKAVDDAVEAKEWGDEDFERLLKDHRRTPYS